MLSTLNIVDRGDELIIQSERKFSRAEAIMSTVATGGFTAIIAFQVVEGMASILLAVCAASLAFLSVTRKHRKYNIELRITRLKFVLRGRVGDNLRSKWNVSSWDIQWLEYQADTTGPESSYHPGGLYAILEHGSIVRFPHSICLLPDLDEPQTALIIKRIEDKFPEFRRRWARASPYGRHYTTLRLNEPESRGQATTFETE